MITLPLKEHPCICRIRKCEYRELLKVGETFKKNIDISMRHRTCIYHDSSFCRGNKLFNS